MKVPCSSTVLLQGNQGVKPTWLLRDKGNWTPGSLLTNKRSNSDLWHASPSREHFESLKLFIFQSRLLAVTHPQRRSAHESQPAAGVCHPEGDAPRHVGHGHPAHVHLEERRIHRTRSDHWTGRCSGIGRPVSAIVLGQPGLLGGAARC